MSLVYEKENGLREIMKMMGLKMWVYWLVTYFFDLLLYVITTFLIILLGVALGFRYFILNSPVLIFLFFFIWGNTMIALAFLLSVFFVKTRSAIIIGYIILILSGIISDSIINPIITESSTTRFNHSWDYYYPPICSLSWFKNFP